MQRITAMHRRNRAALAILDGIVLMAAMIIAGRLRFGGTAFSYELEQLFAHPGFLAFAVILQFGLATTFELYQPQRWRTKDYLLLRMAAVAVTMVAGLAVGVYVVGSWRFGRGLLVLTFAISVPVQLAARLLWVLASSIPHPLRAVVIGNGPIVGALERELKHQPSPPFVIERHIPVATDTSDLDLDPTMFDNFDLVIVASVHNEKAVARLTALNFRGTAVVDAAGAYASLTGRIPVRQVDSRWFIATGDFSSLASSPFHYVQRYLDVFAATVILIAAAPVLAVAALALLVTDGRPILYRQIRVGRFGKPFEIVKLRTLRSDSDANGPEFVEPDDDRVLPVGRVLRRWRIDELPQLVNVLRGNMSLVGPRPERPDIAHRLEREIPFYAFRYSVRPGLTGWAQVHLPYCRTTEDHVAKLEFDLYAIRHHGPGTYAIVLLRTLGSLIFRPVR